MIIRELTTKANFTTNILRKWLRDARVIFEVLASSGDELDAALEELISQVVHLGTPRDERLVVRLVELLLVRVVDVCEAGSRRGSAAPHVLMPLRACSGSVGGGWTNDVRRGACTVI